MMTLQRWIHGAGVALIGAAVLAVPTMAHHSSAPFYDATKSVEVVMPVM